MKRLSHLFASALVLSMMLAGCSNSSSQSQQADSVQSEQAAEENIEEDSEESAAQKEQEEETIEKADDTGLYNTLNVEEDFDTLKETVKKNLTQATYHSDEYNLDLPYGVYVPEGYSEEEEYPLVMFIPDSSLAGKDVEAIIDQGYGGVVWADQSVQTGNPCIILYPAYPDVVVDDHDGYSTIDYLPATIGLIDQIRQDYKIDENRIYATGQSMGCMISMILASENPDLFAACMFVDGQWDPQALAPLADQTFVYFAAYNDTSAYEGMQAAIPIWQENGASIVEESWDGGWSHEELQDAALKMVEQDSKIYCVVWADGTITPKEMGMMGGGPQGGSVQQGQQMQNPSDGGSQGPMQGAGPQGGQENGQNGGPSGGMSSVGYHMASFDYAYRVNTMVGWTLLQTKS